MGRCPGPRPRPAPGTARARRRGARRCGDAPSAPIARRVGSRRPRGHERGHLGLVEAQPTGPARRTRQLGEHRRDLGSPPRRAGSRRPAAAGPARPADQEPHQVQRRGVAPLEVVEHHDQRLPGRPRERAGRRRRRGAAAAPRGPPPRPPVGRTPAPAAARARRDGRVRAARPSSAAQRLGPRPPGRRLRVVPAGAPGDRPAGRLDLVGEPAQQRGLADSGLTGDQDQPGRGHAGPGRCPGNGAGMRRPASPTARCARRTPAPRHCRAGAGAARQVPDAILAEPPTFWRVPGCQHHHPRRTS